MEQIKAILFDLDGVVVFTDKYHFLGWKRLANEQGWDFDEQLNHQCRGIPRMASLEVILKYNGIELPQDEKLRLAERKNHYYRELLCGIDQESIYPDILPFLGELKRRGIPLSICSSSKNAHQVLESLNLKKYFNAVITGDHIKNPKPHPEIFQMGAAALGVPAENCLVFEDAASGVEAALAAGMRCVGIGTPDHLRGANIWITDYTTIELDTLLNRPDHTPCA